jgi:hypothetical protein
VISTFLHKRDKPGVLVEFHVRTDTPLSPGVYVKLASLVEGINMLFDQIPETSTEGES